MKETLCINIGHLLDTKNNSNLISLPCFESLLNKNSSAFYEIKESLEKKTSPITNSFFSEPPLSTIKSIAKSLQEKYENILIIGIGGSTSGFRTIFQTLKGPYYNIFGNIPRVFILDNIDPVLVMQLGNLLDFKKTALIYISKSGSTAEPAANFIYFFNKYKKAGGDMKDIVIICDPGENGINNIAKNLGCYLLHISPELPGRYSVLSPVGFLPSEIIGINSKHLLEGAAKVHNAIINTPKDQNAIFVLGSCISEFAKRGKSIHVLFNYSNILTEFGCWFEQLWAESLAKKKNLTGTIINAGTTPIASLGATDQHSLLQLFNEGPNDKIFGFTIINKFPSDVILTNEFPDEIEYSYLAGHTIGEQLKIEQISTENSLVHTGRPCYRIILPDISPYTLGALFYFFEALVIFVAKLWEVNPYNQPGVEQSKKMTYFLMGRKDYSNLQGKEKPELILSDNQNHMFHL